MLHALPAKALVTATILASAGLPPSAVPRATARTVAAAPQTPGVTSTTCADVLTDDEVVAAVGRRGPTSEKHVNAPGTSQCRWLWSDTGSNISVSYTNTAGIAARAATTRCCPDQAKPLPAQFFEFAIRMDVDLGSEPPASLTGIGERAALFFEDAYLKLVVQRPDGVASIVGASITREQMLALAKAIAAP